jgi:tetratricopeptide (TPR) repeat protein
VNRAKSEIAIDADRRWWPNWSKGRRGDAMSEAADITAEDLFRLVARAEDKASWDQLHEAFGATVIRSVPLMAGLVDQARSRQVSDPAATARVMKWLGEARERNGDEGLPERLMSADSDAEVLKLLRDNADSITPELGASAVREARRLVGQPHPLAARAAERVLRRGELVAEFLGDKETKAEAALLRSVMANQRGAPESATAHCLSAAQLFGELGDAFNQARAIGQAGSFFLEQGRIGEAEDALRRSLALLAEDPTAHGLFAPTFEELALIAARSERWGEAAKCWSRAADHRRALGQTLREARALRGAAVMSNLVAGAEAETLDYAERAVRLTPPGGDGADREDIAQFADMIAGRCLAEAGAEGGQYDRWAMLAEQVATLSPDPATIARIDLVAAKAAAQHHDMKGARDRAKAALENARRGDASLVAEASMVYAYAAIASGDAAPALRELQDTLDRLGPTGDPVTRAELQRLRSAALGKMGRLAEAAEAAKLAGSLETAMEPAARTYVAAAIKAQEFSLAIALRDVERATLLGLDLLAAARSLGSAERELSAMHNLGVAAGMMGQYGHDLPRSRIQELLSGIVDALPDVGPADTADGVGRRLLQHVVAGLRGSGNRAEFARALAALSNLDSDPEQRLAMLLEAHAELSAAAGSPSSEAIVLANLGKAYRALGANDAAENCLACSLQLSEACGDYQWAYDTALELSDFVLDRDGIAEQAKMLRRAIGYIELARLSLPASDRNLLAFDRGKARPYRRLIRSNLERGRVAAAFDALQQMKARALLSAHSGGDDGETDIQADSLRLEEQALLVRLRSAETDGTESKLDLLAELDRVYDALAEYNPRYVARRRGKPLDFDSVRRLLKQQDRPAILIDFFVSDDSAAAFLVRSDWDNPVYVDLQLTTSELTTVRQDFERQVVNYRGAGPETWRSPAEALVRPLAAHLREGDLAYLVPHDLLHGMPLHAFPIEGRPMCARHDVAYLPAASFLAVVGALPTVRGLSTACCIGVDFIEEAEAVAALFKDTVLLTGPVLADSVEAAARGRDVIHISAHGVFDPDNAALSGIVIGGLPAGGLPSADSILSAERISRMDFDGAIVCLSACVSAAGVLTQGDELLGIQRGCFIGGAASVVSALWPVDAAVTQEFMAEFYRELIASHGRTGKVDKVAAFRFAQDKIRRREADINEYYWAAFTISGDWR